MKPQSDPPINRISNAAKLALRSCPKTDWTASPVWDYAGQKLEKSEIMEELLEQASNARAEIAVMIVQWALTGTWPKFKDAPVYFLNEMLTSSAARKGYSSEKSFPEAALPWTPKYIARFLEQVLLWWFGKESEAWARENAQSIYHLQEW